MPAIVLSEVSTSVLTGTPSRSLPSKTFLSIRLAWLQIPVSSQFHLGPHCSLVRSPNKKGTIPARARFVIFPPVQYFICTYVCAHTHTRVPYTKHQVWAGQGICQTFQNKGSGLQSTQLGFIPQGGLESHVAFMRTLAKSGRCLNHTGTYPCLAHSLREPQDMDPTHDYKASLVRLWKKGMT